LQHDSFSEIIDSLTELKRISQLNMELLEQLSVTCDWLRKSGVKLPNQSAFDSLLNKTMALLDEIQADEPKILVYKKLSDDGYHEPDNRREVNRTLFSTHSLTCQSTHLLHQSFQTNLNSVQSSALTGDSTCELSCPALGSKSRRRCRIQLQA
jgi:hypothetical protein